MQSALSPEVATGWRSLRSLAGSDCRARRARSRRHGRHAMRSAHGASGVGWALGEMGQIADPGGRAPPRGVGLDEGTDVRHIVQMLVPTLDLRQDIQPVSEFRANTAATLKRARDTGRPVLLTQNGRAAAVLLDVDLYQALVEELATLRDIQAGLEDAHAGRVVAHAAARERVLARTRR